MDTVAKQKWVDALRSGKYKQGHGALKTVGPSGEERFCCLGVLCDIVGVEWQHTDTSNIYAKKYGMASAGILPSSVGEEVGLRFANPEVQGQTLSRWNDDGFGFDYIADLIEQYL